MTEARALVVQKRRILLVMLNNTACCAATSISKATMSQHISVYLDTRVQVDKVLCDLRCCILEAFFSPSCSFNKPSPLRMQENCRTWSRSPLLAPDSSAVRERLLGSSVLQVWRRENKGRGMRVQLTQNLMRVVMLPSASDNVKNQL